MDIKRQSPARIASYLEDNNLSLINKKMDIIDITNYYRSNRGFCEKQFMVCLAWLPERWEFE